MKTESASLLMVYLMIKVRVVGNDGNKTTRAA